MTPYPELWYPYTLPFSNQTLPNRLMLAPMTTYSSHANGIISQAEIDYLRRRAAGGFGTIITAACYVDQAGQGFVGQWGCSDDRFLESLRSAADAIKAEGATALLQIHDAGRMSDPTTLSDLPRAPSAIAPERPNAVTPREMSAEEIEQSIVAFAAAAQRAVQAGYNGVEIHGANTYLVQQFFSPHSNRRTDRWGGTIDERIMYPVELIQAVRHAVGDEIIVGYRFSPEETENPGITIEDTLDLLEVISSLDLDYLHLSLGELYQTSLRDSADTKPVINYMLEQLVKDLPLVGVGSITRPELAVDAIHNGIPLLAIGRAALYEPEWPAKVKAGNADQLRTCLPKQNGAEICTLPKPLYERLLNRPGWIPICDE